MALGDKMNRYKYIWSWAGINARLFVLSTEVSRVVGHCADHWLPFPLAAPLQPSGFPFFLPDRGVCWEFSVGEPSHGCRGCEGSAQPLCLLILRCHLLWLYFLSCFKPGTLNLEPSVKVPQ